MLQRPSLMLKEIKKIELSFKASRSRDWDDVWFFDWPISLSKRSIEPPIPNFPRGYKLKVFI